MLRSTRSTAKWIYVSIKNHWNFLNWIMKMHSQTWSHQQQATTDWQRFFFCRKNKLFQTTCQHVWLIIKTTMSTIISFSPLLKKNHFFLSSSERSVMYLCILSDAITHWVFFSKFLSNWPNHCFSTCQNLHFGLQISSIPLYFEDHVFPYSFRPWTVSQHKFSLLGKKLKFAATIWISYNFQIQKRIVSA